MKKYITILCYIILACTASLGWSQAEDDVIDSTVEPFVTALQSGDIEALKSYTAGNLYQDIIEKSQQNRKYDDFLKQHYAGAIFHASVVHQDIDKVVVSVNVDFQGKGASVFELIIEKNSMGVWSIIEQYSPTQKKF